MQDHAILRPTFAIPEPMCATPARLRVPVRMNYLSHSYRFLDDPYFVAGTAVPDWLNVVDRRVRARSRLAEPWVQASDARVAAVARGIVQHHHDDQWFHQTAAFAELSLRLTVAIRDALGHDSGLRPSFLGHILVEMFLDAALIEEQPALLDDYYSAVEAVDPGVVARAVSCMATRPADGLEQLIPRFSAERFLYDYTEDGKLLKRLNQVLRRVQLPLVPEALADLFPRARRMVSERRTELLCGSASDSFPANPGE